MDSLLRSAAPILLMTAILAGCDGVFDDTESSAEIYARLKVFSNGGEQPVLLMADLREGGGDNASRADLDGDDRLLASHDQAIGELIGQDGGVFDSVGGLTDAVEELDIQGRTFFRPYQVQLTSPGYLAYASRFDDIRQYRRFYVYLWRDDGDSVGDSWVTLPPPFEIIAPANGQTLSRSESIALSWSNPGSGDAMRLHIRGDCEDGSEVEAAIDLGADDGDESVPVSAFEGDIGNDATTDCDLRLLVRRLNPGTINPGYGRGGSFEGIEQRWVDIRSTP